MHKLLQYIYKGRVRLGFTEHLELVDSLRLFQVFGVNEIYFAELLRNMKIEDP